MIWCRRHFLNNGNFLSCVSTRNAARDVQCWCPSCAHICEEWWVLEDGLHDKVSIADKAMPFKQMFDRLHTYLSLACRSTAISSDASFIVSRHSVISHSSRSTRADLFVYVCVADAASARPPPPLAHPHAFSAASHSCTWNRRVWRKPLKNTQQPIITSFFCFEAKIRFDTTLTEIRIWNHKRLCIADLEIISGWSDWKLTRMFLVTYACLNSLYISAIWHISWK